jgi:DHA3 family macrolide efflux protein-like MFS transporter
MQASPKNTMPDWKKTFMTIWAGQAVSMLTSSVLQMSIVWYLTMRTESAAILTLATLTGFLPRAVLGSFCGTIVDRYDRKRVMIAADLFIAAASSLLAVAGEFGEIPIWLIFAVLFLRSIGAAFHYPSLHASTPLIVPREQLTKYAGYSQGFESISMVISPGLAALLYGIWKLNVIVLLDILGAIAAVSLLLFVKLERPVREQVCRRSLLAETREGIDAARREPGMIALMVVSALYAIVYFPIGTLYPLITMTHFQGGYRESGIVETLFSLGLLFGAVLLSRIGQRINRPRAFLWSIGLYGAGILLTGLLPPADLPVFMALSLINGLSVPFYSGVRTAIFQHRIEERYLGRVLALCSSVTMAAMPLGLLLAGSFAEVIGVTTWFSISGILTMLLAGVSALLPSFRLLITDDYRTKKSAEKSGKNDDITDTEC